MMFMEMIYRKIVTDIDWNSLFRTSFGASKFSMFLVIYHALYKPPKNVCFLLVEVSLCWACKFTVVAHQSLCLKFN